MSVLGLIFGSRRESQLSQLTETLAAQSSPHVVSRLSGQVAAMSPAEVRGYIRARAGAIVHRDVKRAMQDTSLRKLVRAGDDMIEMVMAAVIRRVQNELRQKAVQPVRVRAAA